MNLPELHEAGFWIDLAVKLGIVVVIALAVLALGYVAVVGLAAGAVKRRPRRVVEAAPEAESLEQVPAPETL